MHNNTTVTNHKRGILFMLIASFLFAVVGVFVKKLSIHMSSLEIVFFRNIFMVTILIVSFYGIPIKQTGGKPLLLFLRGFVGFLALLMFFYNIVHLSLAEAMIFSKLSSLFTPLFAFFIFKEYLKRRSWLAIFIGFIGIIFITEFQGTLSKNDFLGILSGIFAAFAYMCIKALKDYYDTRIIILSFGIIGTIIPAIFMSIAHILPKWEIITYIDFIIAPFVMPVGIDWLYLIIMGACATGAQVFMTKAYSYSKAGIISTISYSNVLFSILLGFLIADPFPSMHVLIGIVLIVISGIIVAKG